MTDSGGAGFHRGGNGVEKRYVYLEPGHVSIHDDRWLTRPWGVLGGEPGERSSKLLRRADGTEEVLPAKCDEVEVRPGRHARLPHGGRRRLEGPARPAGRGGRARRRLRAGLAREGAGRLRRRAGRRRERRRGGHGGRARAAAGGARRRDGVRLRPVAGGHARGLRGGDRAAGAEAGHAAALVAAGGRRRGPRAGAGGVGGRGGRGRRARGRRERGAAAFGGAAASAPARGRRRRPHPRLHRPGVPARRRPRPTWSGHARGARRGARARPAGVLHDDRLRRGARARGRGLPAQGAARWACCGRGSPWVEARRAARPPPGRAACSSRPSPRPSWARHLGDRLAGPRRARGVRRDHLGLRAGDRRRRAPARPRADRPARTASATAGPTRTAQSLYDMQQKYADVLPRAAVAAGAAPAAIAGRGAGPAGRRAPPVGSCRRYAASGPGRIARVWDVAGDLAAALERLLSGIADAVAGVAVGLARPGGGAARREPGRPRAAAGTRSCARPRTTIPRCGAATRSARGWPARAPAGACRRAAATPCACSCWRRGSRAPAPRASTGTLVAEGAGELARRRGSSSRSPSRVGVGPPIGVPAAGDLWIVPVAALAVLALARLRPARPAPAADRRRRRPRAARRCARPRAYARARAALAAREPRVPRRGAGLLPRRLRPARDAGDRPAGDARPGRRPPASRSRPPRSAPGRRCWPRPSSPSPGTAVPAGQLAAFFVGTSTALTVVGTVLALTICLRSARGRRCGRCSRQARPSPSAGAGAHASAERWACSAGAASRVAVRRGVEAQRQHAEAVAAAR